MLVESAADDTVAVPTEEDLVPGSPRSNLDAEIEEANSSATTSTNSTTTTNTPVPTPTNTSSATNTSTATITVGGQPSSSRSLSRPLRTSAKNMAGRCAGAKRQTDTLLVLAETEECAAERQEKWEEKRRKQAELEDRRSEREMQHEERMHSMFMSVFQQMMGGGWGPAPYPPMHPMLPPFQPATTENNGDNPWPPTTSHACGTCPIAAIWLPRADFYLRMFPCFSCKLRRIRARLVPNRRERNPL